MKHSLFTSYGASIFFLGIILLLSVVSLGHFYNPSAELTTTYSANVIKSFRVRIFGSFAVAMMIVSGIGVLLQIKILYLLLNYKKYKKKFKKLYGTAWIILFAPYVVILILAFNF